MERNFRVHTRDNLSAILARSENFFSLVTLYSA